MLPDLRHVYLYSEENPIVLMGRSVNSILNWSETGTGTSATVNQSSRPSESGEEMRDSMASSATSDWRKTFSSEFSESDDPSNSNSTVSSPPELRTFSHDAGGIPFGQKRTVSGASYGQSSIHGPTKLFSHSRSADGSDCSDDRL